MSLDVQVWALGRGGAPDVALPDLGDYAVTPLADDVGSISLDYPRDGRGFAALRAVQTQDRPVEVEVRTDGTSATALRCLLFTASGDDIKPGSVWTFTGYDLGVLLRDYVLPYNANLAQGGNERGETSLTGTFGTIVRTLMQRAQAAGYLLDIGFGSFTNTADSRGAAWAVTTTVTLSPGIDLVEILRTLSEAGLGEWEVTNGRQLRGYNPGTRGIDRAVPGPLQLTLEHGRDLADAPVRHDVTDARTNLTTSGKDGLYSAATNATALARIGWRRGGYQSFGNIADQGSLDAVTQLAAAAGGDGAEEQTHGLVLESGSMAVPGRDFLLGDFLLRAVNGTTVRRQVVRYSLNRKGREITATVTLGDLIQARAVRTQKAIDSIANGSTVVGTSAPPPADVDDGKAPATPQGVSASSLAYFDREGTPLAQLSVGWLPVTTNEDGTPIADLAGYNVQWRYNGGGLPTGWNVGVVAPDTATVSFSPLAVGQAVEVRVYAFDRYDRASEFSTVVGLFTALNTTPPPVLSAPTPYSHLGLLVVPWDGRGAAGEAMPTNFGVAEVHISTTSGFTPSRPLDGNGRLNLAASTTYAGELRGAGELPIDIGAAGYGITHYVKLVAVNRGGYASAASAQGSAVLARVADGDIAGMSIGKLMVGIMSAIMTVSGIIRTAAAGARVELDTAGLRCIAADGRVLFEFSIPNSLLTIVGRLIAGAGVGVGATIVVDPTVPIQRWYPNATLTHIEQRAFDAIREDGTNGGVFNTAVREPSGATDGGFSQFSDRGIFFLIKDTLDRAVGGRLTLARGNARMSARPAGASNTGGTAYVDVSGLVDIRNETLGNGIQFGTTGNVSIRAASGQDIVFQDAVRVRATVPFGTPNAGFSFMIRGIDNGGYRTEFSQAANVIRFVDNDSNTFVGDGAGGLKSFVIPHPLDPDRWLVHGCTEGPTAGVEYHGVADVDEHAAVVELPAWFEAATRADGRQVQLTVELPELPDDLPASPPGAPALGPASATEPGALDPGPPGAPAVPEWARLPTVAAGPIVDGRFRIACSTRSARVAWRVFAVRADVEAFDVEPLRESVSVHGDGPYRYVTDGTGSA